MEDIEQGPHHTLYVSNLPEKIRIDDLTKALHVIFGQFGNIIDVVARKTNKLRGQAWIVFDDVAAAEKAHKLMQGFKFMNKPLKIAYAKEKSDAVAKLDGSFREEEAEARRQKRREANQEKAQVSKPTAAPTAARPSAPIPEAGTSPNSVLLAENLPDSANEAMISLIFQQFPGFRAVRMVPKKKGTALVEYDDAVGATAALTGLQGFRIATDKPLQLSFAAAQP